MEVSPKYLMKLVEQIEKKIWDEFSSYKNVRNYIKKWHKNNDQYFEGYWENFRIYEEGGKINLNETLHDIDPGTVIKMAIDLGIDTPGFIPTVPVIKNILKIDYPTAFNSFQSALKQTVEDPDLSVGSANSTLESIIKHILENDNILTKLNTRDTLYGLTESILREFSLFPDQQMPIEIRDIGSSLLNISRNIEKLRSEKTKFHGKTKKDYVIRDPLYAYFIVNTVSTLGLFLISFYENKYNNKDINKNDGGVVQSAEMINLEDIPF